MFQLKIFQVLVFYKLIILQTKRCEFVIKVMLILRLNFSDALQMEITKNFKTFENPLSSTFEGSVDMHSFVLHSTIDLL